jgi:hypothetical protein
LGGSFRVVPSIHTSCIVVDSDIIQETPAATIKVPVAAREREQHQQGNDSWKRREEGGHNTLYQQEEESKEFEPSTSKEKRSKVVTPLKTTR